MKKTILLISTLALFSCSGNDNKNTTTTEKVMVVNSNIQKIDTKKEDTSNGNFNQMTLFIVTDETTFEEIKAFCSENKSYYEDGIFQILVFCKDKNIAKFPNNPVTGGFMEDADLKNIKAIYTINNANGYSKLDFYEKNAFESSPNSTDIKLKKKL